MAASLSWQVRMPHNLPPSADRSPVTAPRSLTDRVRDRVMEAGLALDRRIGPGDRKSRRPRPTRLGMPAASRHAPSEATREAQSLRRVYRELRATYQRHRRTTGRPPVPELREAVHAFKRGPSLTSLVGIAEFLEDRSLLAW
ncbi:MAG: hypothetical protein HOP28_14765 [Gemmatimonadales bacterium]|nr:hypothetical protein [Gemmatimonadales bacterium]